MVHITSANARTWFQVIDGRCTRSWSKILKRLGNLIFHVSFWSDAKDELLLFIYKFFQNYNQTKRKVGPVTAKGIVNFSR
jgi:hypothetical protein